MTLRAEYNEGGRKNKQIINPSHIDYDAVQDSKFQLSFNYYGIFHNQKKSSKYQKILQQYAICPYPQYQRHKNQNKYVQNQQMKIKNKQQRDKPLSEIYNIETSNHICQNYEKTNLVGSIRRNKKQSIVWSNNILHSQFFQNGIDLEEIQQLRLSKMEEMQTRLNKVINKENIQYLEEETKKQYKGKKTILQDRKEKFNLSNGRQNKSKGSTSKVNSQDKQNHISFSKNNEVQQFSETDYLQFLFEILDYRNKGMLQKSNCRIDLLPQEFKFIFGSIFTRIFLKKLTCNKRQFVKLCMNNLKQLNSVQIIDLLKLFAQRFQSRQKLFENQHRFFRQSNPCETDLKMQVHSKEYNKQISFQYRIHQNQYLSKEWDQSNRPQALQKYNKESTCNSILKQTFISQINSNCSESTITSKKQEKQPFIYSMKRKSISESTIQKHKQNLHEMQDLQRKMSEVLKYEVLKQSQNLQKNCASGTENLNFSQLVKHI